MSPELAAYVRDLLLDMRQRMLDHQSRKAVQTTGATGYRVAASEEAPPLEAEEPASDAPTVRGATS